MIRITLPFPPTLNNLFINAGKKRVKSPGYTAWLQLAAISIKDAHRQSIGEYSIHICCRRPDKRRRDIANLEKGISDLLVSHGVIKDDSLCQRMTIQWDDDMEPECVVLIQPAERGMAA